MTCVIEDSRDPDELSAWSYELQTIAGLCSVEWPDSVLGEQSRALALAQLALSRAHQIIDAL
jgi:hypothetical protein